jgi:hypothetical protein
MGRRPVHSGDPLSYQDLGKLVARIAELEGELEHWRPKHRPRRIALAMIVEKQAAGDVLGQWLEILRRSWWPGPVFRMRPIYVVWGRNSITAGALDRPGDDWTDLYWIDSDMLPDVGLVSRLYELTSMPEYLAPDGGVICGSYYGRGYPFELQLFEKRPQEQGLFFIPPQRWLPLLEQARRLYLELKSAPLLPIGGGGTGSMLIRRDVLQRMQDLKGRGQVWDTPPIPPEMLAKLKAAGEDKPGGTWSEDVWFCVEVAEKLGIQVYADTDLRLSSAHMWEDRVGPNHYVAGHSVPNGYHLEKQVGDLPVGYEVQPVPDPRPRRERRAAARLRAR